MVGAVQERGVCAHGRERARVRVSVLCVVCAWVVCVLRRVPTASFHPLARCRDPSSLHAKGAHGTQGTHGAHGTHGAWGTRGARGTHSTRGEAVGAQDHNELMDQVRTHRAREAHFVQEATPTP